MGALAAKYPNAKRLEVEASVSDSEEDVLGVLTPYLHWELGEIDTNGTDILIFRKDEAGDQGIREMLLLGAREAGIWLRFRQSYRALQ